MGLPAQYDVIVVGAGGSGLAAACSAAQNRARVLVLEERPEPGGTTGVAAPAATGAPSAPRAGSFWQGETTATMRK